MSSRFILSASSLLAVSVIAFGFSAPNAAAEMPAPTVETFVDEALPVERPSTRTRTGAPLPAGSLTLDDVLRAHPKPPILQKAPTLPSTSSLMMSEGLKSVLQKVGISAATPPTIVQAPKFPSPQAQGAATPNAPVPEVSGVLSKNYGTVYAPGQAPKPLGGVATKAKPACDAAIQKWEKSCAEVGYPAAFAGKISGETRGNCTDGSLQDVWVTNTCAPPGVAATQPAEKAAEKAPASTTVSETPKKSEAAPATAANGEGVGVSSCEEGDMSEACAALAAQIQTENKEPVRKNETSSGGFFSRTWDSVVDVFSFSSSDESEPKASAQATEEAAEAGTTATASRDASKDANDFCGSAAETLAYAAPAKNLCRIGTASAVSGDGPWTWSCANNAGATSACRTLSLAEPGSEAAKTTKATSFLKLPKSTAKASAAKPECGAASGQPAKAKPASDLCASGKASAVRGNNPWKWTCGPAKKKVSCETVKVLDGSCGSANGMSFKSAPSKNLCKKGTAGSVNGEGPWVWSCDGMGGGSPASCSAQLAVTPEAVPPKPEVLKEKVKIPAPKKSLAPSLTPSPVPAPAKVEGDEAPEAPSLPEESNPVPPPEAKEPLPVTPTLKEVPEMAPKAGGPRSSLVIDPAISTILFSRGSGILEERIYGMLDKLVSLLQKNTSARISLFAYADSHGTTPRAAKRLSLTRALAVRDYLASKGVSESRVDVHPEGTDTSTGYVDRVDVKAND